MARLCTTLESRGAARRSLEAYNALVEHCWGFTEAELLVRPVRVGGVRLAMREHEPLRDGSTHSAAKGAVCALLNQ